MIGWPSPGSFAIVARTFSHKKAPIEIGAKEIFRRERNDG